MSKWKEDGAQAGVTKSRRDDLDGTLGLAGVADANAGAPGTPDSSGAQMSGLKLAIRRFLDYLHYERNASPKTTLNYGLDLEQFHSFVTPPGLPTPSLSEIDHRLIREYLGFLYDRKLEKTSVAVSYTHLG